MILDARDFSTWERCSLLPMLQRQVRPMRERVRDATARMFLEHVPQGNPEMESQPELIAEALLAQAARPGFTYTSDGEPYVIANDHVSWLAGALYLAEEWDHSGILIPHLQLSNDHAVYVGGWLTGNVANLWRVVDEFRDEQLEPHWPELLAMTLVDTVRMHLIRLPATRNGRVHSPLCLGYRHPKGIGNLRLARFTNDGGADFKRSWKRVGRWEQTDIGWDEWRRGIDADQCLDQCVRVIDLQSDPPSGILNDARVIAEMIASGLGTKRQEACRRCTHRGWCHGTNIDKEWYVQVGRGTDTHMPTMPGTEAPRLVRAQ